MKNTSLFLITASICFFLLISCRHQFEAPIKVKEALNKAGRNKGELETVIENYKKEPADTLKLKAAYYIISNMDGWYYYQGDLLDHYQEYLKLIRKDQDHGEYFLNSFFSLYGPYTTNRIDRKLDIKEVKAYQIIKNIDMAFKVWEEQPWGKDITFDQFCEYILPFRIFDETPEYGREQIYNQFNKVLDSVRKAKGDAIAACTAINIELTNPNWIFSLRTSFLPHYKASQIIKFKVGSCREMTDLAFYAMRATGIPVAIDFVPQWPYRSMGHEFNTVLNKKGKSIIFLGAEDSPGITIHKAGTKKGKVFRHTYAENPVSLGAIKTKRDIVPPFLEDSRIKDVTDEYVKCTDVKIGLTKKTGLSQIITKFAYITVFDNQNWVPVHWGFNKNNQVIFTKMEGDIVYLAGYFDGMKIIPASDPFILSKEGSVKFLRTKFDSLITNMSFSRIFPIIPDVFDTWHMSGCQFQGANNADFSDAVNLYTINVKPNPFWNEIQIKTDKKFRYVRYFSKGYSHMGKLEFYGLGKKLKGNAFGSKVGWYKDKTFDKVFDNNIFTYFDPSGAVPSTTFVGLDLGKKEVIDKIRFSAPLQEDTKVKIIKGHNYQLFYWDEGKWESIDTKIATDSLITFQNIPSHALYFLHDNSETVAERIFTYENGKQIWW